MLPSLLRTTQHRLNHHPRLHLAGLSPRCPIFPWPQVCSEWGLACGLRSSTHTSYSLSSPGQPTTPPGLTPGDGPETASQSLAGGGTGSCWVSDSLGSTLFPHLPRSQPGMGGPQASCLVSRERRTACPPQKPLRRRQPPMSLPRAAWRAQVWGGDGRALAISGRPRASPSLLRKDAGAKSGLLGKGARRNACGVGGQVPVILLIGLENFVLQGYPCCPLGRGLVAGHRWCVCPV